AGLRSRGGGEYVSGLLALPFAATHLGLHWRLTAASPAALRVGVRTSGDGATWSGWRETSIEAIAALSGSGTAVERSIPVHGHGAEAESREPGRHEVFASLVPAEGGTHVQYRLRFPAGQETSLEAMTVTAIESPAIAAAQTSVDFPLPDDPSRSITVITRAGWGCDERLRFGRRGAEIWPEMWVPVKKVMLHHTATSNDYLDGAAEVRAIYTYHARTLGWGDIGYHLLIDKDGQIYEGRHGRGEDAATREVASDDVVAGHTFAHNYGSTGIAAIGNYDETGPSSALTRTIEDVLTFEFARQYLDPRGVSDFLRSDAIWHDGLANLSGHRDSTATICPGAHLYDQLDALREQVAARLSGVGSAVVPALTEMTGAARDLTEPADLAFAWSSAESAYLYSFEGWSKGSRSEDIEYLSGYQADGAGDPLAWRQVWVGPTDSTTASFSNLAAGRYTMHVRTRDGHAVASRTWNVSSRKGRK
ncbi:MAG: N-acetylmuramoyl-L-alanine amidase, partial [Vicinamibacterales bacterium]